MTSMQYLESGEVLYYMDRLDRYTPMTAKFIRQDAADVITPLAGRLHSGILMMI